MPGFPALSDVQRTDTKRWRLLLLTLLFSLCAAAHAQSAPPPDPADVDSSGADAGGDPPSRVARLSYQAGDLGLLPAGEKDWSDASVNRPLTTGDRLSSGQGARAELELDGGALRIAQNTDFGFLTLNDQMTQVELTQGTLNVAVRQLGEGESYEIDTPTVALVIDQPGTYRVDISGDGKATRVTDFDGSAVVFGQNGAQRGVDSGSRYEFNDSGLTDVAVSPIGGGDEFDNWASQRDQRYAQSTTTRQYVSEEVVGYQDLDQYGDWQSDSDYGEVWYPSQVDVGWAPYRNGHWAYVGPWGWTWVDDLPWGFAPYHYGRWVCLRGRWGWLPGPIVRRPVYAPALVAFVGGGRIGIGGPVGWFPLGPGEVYNPWYRASRGYYTRVNYTNIRERGLERAAIMDRINHHYDYFNRGQPFPNQRFVNRDAPRAFSSMSAQNFVGARNVQHNLLAGDAHQFANAPVLARGVAVRPTAASFAQPRAAQARPLPSGGFSRQVVARTAPSASMLHQGPLVRAAGPAGGAARPAFNNVRVLDGHGPGNLAGRPAPVAAQAAPRGESFAQPARAPEAQPGQRPDMRNGELPSSRFAHPEPGAAQANGRAAWQNRIERSEPQNNNMPRPGASFITNAEEDRARAAAQNPAAQQRTLPSAPQFNRPSPESLNRPAPQEQQRFERDDNRPRPNFDAQQRQEQQQQQQQRNFAQPQQRLEMQQRGFQAPQQQMQQQQRFEQPQREQPRAAPQGHPEPRSAPEHHGNNNDDHH
jgi:hypothetical protein